MKQKILAIDSSNAMRFLLQTVLGKDYQVITAPDGCSAMAWLSKKNLPELVIMDARLPDMYDWEMAEQFVSSGIYRDIPILILSSFDKNTTLLKCTELGIAEYFTKPFNPVELANAVHRIMNRHKKVAALEMSAN